MALSMETRLKQNLTSNFIFFHRSAPNPSEKMMSMYLPTIWVFTWYDSMSRDCHRYWAGKEQVLVYQNQLSNLFCRVGWSNSLNKAFSENSSLTIENTAAIVRMKIIQPVSFCALLLDQVRSASPRYQLYLSPVHDREWCYVPLTTTVTRAAGPAMAQCSTYK